MPRSMESLGRQRDAALCACFLLIWISFKTVNDTLGHRYGDKVLCSVAECFRQVLRTSDIIGRVGGDEFVGLSLRSRFPLMRQGSAPDACARR